MALLHYLWSRVAANNATADANVGWSEGQAPSSVNDSARAMMASAAGVRDDIAGAIVTGGTSTAYTVTSYQIFSTLALMSGHMIAFTPHTTNGATVTLNVDGLGAKALRSSTGVELLAGTLIAGTPYTATYNNSDAVWYLHNFYGNPYNVPLGGAMPFIGSTAPNSSFVFPYGQAISRTTYATLFSLVSTTYGVGNGSTTFNVPDLRGRLPYGKDDMGGAAASRLTTAGGGLDGATLGAVGGAQNVTLAENQIPSLTSINASQAISVTSTVSTLAYGFQSGAVLTNNGGSWYGAGSLGTMTIGGITSTDNNSISVAYTNASPTATKTVSPGMSLNYILRII
jgi:microcystin-dependent protein